MGSNSSILRILAFFIFLILCCKNVTAQTIIFKKNGTQIRVTYIDTLSSSVQYRLPDEPDSISHFISRSIIDSIQFENGFIKRYVIDTPFVEKEEVGHAFKKNFIGVNIWPYFSKRINGFYERLLIKDKLGFKNQFLYDINSSYHPKEYSFSSGVNYYFLHSEYYRFGAGTSIQFNWYDVYNYSNNSYNYQTRTENCTFLILNGSFSYIWKRNWYLTLEIDLPIGNGDHPINHTYLKTEIAFNF